MNTSRNPKLALIVASAACWLAGCSEPVGGKYTTIEMTSKPAGADAYLMTLDEWNKLAGTAGELTEPPPAKYKVGQTPVKKKVLAYRQVYVAWKDGKYRVVEFLPKIPGDTVEIEVPSP